MTNKDKGLTEFEKLLEESDIDISKVLNEKNNEDENFLDHKSFQDIKVSLDDLYEKNLEDYFSHKKNGIQTKVLDKLRNLKYKFSSSQIIDLHGMTTEEALIELNIFIKKNYENQSKYILIIHGKGLNNKEGVAPLKRLVQKLIINCDIAMASTSAGIKDGGYGATYVLLKNSYI
jgi:DNA-nicking Smr family endonuclease